MECDRMKKLVVLGVMNLLISGLVGCSHPPLEELNSADIPTGLVVTAEVESQSPSKNNEFFEEVKNYILYGQENLIEVEKLKWSLEFLKQVDFEKLYTDYLEIGGVSDDIQEFANYVTLHAPINDNWEALTKKSVLKNFDVEIIRFKKIDDSLYQGYAIIDGKEVPYITVNIRTGYYHG